MGFAIPINTAMDIVDEIIQIGYVSRRPSLALTGRNVPSQAGRLPGASYLSAATGEGVEELLLRVEKELDAGTQEVRLLIPFSRYGLLSRLHGMGTVLEQRHVAQGVEALVRLDAQNVKFVCREGAQVLGGEKM